MDNWWLQTGKEVAVNFVANLLFWLILGVSATLWLTWSHRRIRSFFGILRDGSLTIVLSNMWRKKDWPNRKVGYLTSYNELRASENLREIFRPAKVPSSVAGLVDHIWTGKERRVHTVNCPGEDRDPADPTLTQRVVELPSIVVGGAGYNSARMHYLVAMRTSLHFDDEPYGNGPVGSVNPATVIVERLVDAASAEPQELYGDNRIAPHPGKALGIVEKIIASDAVVIFCAGGKGEITRVLAEYVTREWKKLRDEFKEEEFAICLEFPAPVPDHYDYVYSQPKRRATLTFR